MTEFYHSDRSGYADSALGRSDLSHQENISRARQAAEALFARERRVANPAASVTVVSSSGQTVRKPRILSAVPMPPTRVEAVEASVKVVPQRKREKIPAAHFARIRTWVKYGMTISQVAKSARLSITLMPNTALPVPLGMRDAVAAGEAVSAAKGGSERRSEFHRVQKLSPRLFREIRNTRNCRRRRRGDQVQRAGVDREIAGG